MTQSVDYSITRGLPWERLIIVKNRYNHRVIKPTSARAYIKTGVFTKFQITCDITAENGILLSLNGTETQDLPLGSLNFDVWAIIDNIDRPVAKGTVEVSALDNITPLEDTDSMEIRTKERKDFRQTYAWYDSSGALVQLQSAFMQAKNSAGSVVLDLRWFATTPSEATVIALPATRRGYLAPDPAGSFELHISNTNTISAGEYLYDLHAQDNNGDWDVLFSGVLVVEPSISIEPV